MTTYLETSLSISLSDVSYHRLYLRYGESTEDDILKRQSALLCVHPHPELDVLPFSPQRKKDQLKHFSHFRPHTRGTLNARMKSPEMGEAGTFFQWLLTRSWLKGLMERGGGGGKAAEGTESRAGERESTQLLTRNRKLPATTSFELQLSKGRNIARTRKSLHMSRPE